LLITDKLKIGIIAGSIATFVLQILAIIELLFKAKHTYWDYASYILFNHKYQGFAETALSIGIQIFFSVQLGVIYSYLDEKIPTKLCKTKGAMFGGTAWFSITGMLFIYQITQLKTHSAWESSYEFLSGVIYGIVLAIFTRNLKARSWN
jgi:hypothetical protein